MRCASNALPETRSGSQTLERKSEAFSDARRHRRCARLPFRSYVARRVAELDAPAEARLAAERARSSRDVVLPQAMARWDGLQA